MTKFQFRIRTKNGVLMEAINIHGRDREDAERKLFQMYLGCTVLECGEVAATTGREENLDLAGILALIAKQD
jgi:DNA-nicking Smr family endonuclease